MKVFQDEMYWRFRFGVVGSPRLDEIGQIAASDVHRCDLQRTFGEDYKGTCTFVHITGTGEEQSVKNDEFDRYVVIQERLIELGSTTTSNNGVPRTQPDFSTSSPTSMAHSPRNSAVD
jgi:hypothetical protein